MNEAISTSKHGSSPQESVHSHESLDAFLGVETVKNGRHSVDHGYGIVTEILVWDREAATTVITFNGAAYRDSPRPFFQGTAMFDSLERTLGLGPLNRVHVYDGLLADRKELRIGWYLGSPQVDLSAQLTKILQRILRQLRRGKVILFGSSAGGFAALTQGESLADTVVVASNPQTILERFEPSLYREWLELGGWLPAGEALPSPHILSVRTDLRSRFGPFRPRHTYILLNVNDKLHIHSHVIPWIAEIAGGRPVSVLAGKEWGPDHTPAPRRLLEPFLRDLIHATENSLPLREGGNLGQLLEQKSVTQIKTAFTSPGFEYDSSGLELDLRKRGIRISIRDPHPGQGLHVSAGLRASGSPIFRTHLISLELMKDGQEYRGPMQGTVWSKHPGIGHFEYLPLFDGHIRFDRVYTPPAGVSIVGIRFCQWVEKTDAQVVLTDVSIMNAPFENAGFDAPQGKDDRSS